MSLELYVLEFGVYPRRVVIYLKEKGLLDSGMIKITPVDLQGVAPGKPKGTSPMLRLPDGTFIKQSIAILEYFEDICQDPQQEWQHKLASYSKQPTMRGQSAEERARMRSIMGLAEEAMIYFGFACHKGSRVFETVEPSCPEGAKMSMESSKKDLKLIETYLEGDTRFDTDGGIPTIADCILFSFLQFTNNFYSFNILAGSDLPNLERFYENFGRRESTKIASEVYPEFLKDLARQWLF
jgi:glutathione S-transferase